MRRAERTLFFLLWAAALLPSSLVLFESIPPLFLAARFTGVLSLSLLCIQPFLAARYRWLERPVGLDRLMGIHRLTGVSAGIAALLHLVLLVTGGGGTLELNVPWGTLLGRLVLIVLLLFAMGALLRPRIRLPYQKWRFGHGALTPLILTGGFLHGWRVLLRFMPDHVKYLLAAYFAVGIVSWLHLNLGRLLARRKSWSVGSVQPLTSSVTGITLLPPTGSGVPDHKPGQFMFLTLLRGRGLPVEEHPFTIVSSPGGDSVSIAVKDLGDFTSTVGQTKKGDRAAVSMPWGRFSHLNFQESDRLVFIAGGIGITPFMSMIRFLHRQDDDRDALLLWGNRTEEDIAFREELQAIQDRTGSFRFQVVHVLSQPDPDWKGQSGRITGNRLRELASPLDGTDFLVCGPPRMMEAVASDLLLMGVEAKRIHMERFSL